MEKQKLAKAKVIKIIIISIVLLLLTVGISGYFIIHSYISKLNMVSVMESPVPEMTWSVPEDMEAEDPDSEATDSPEDEILTLEEKIQKNMEENSTPIVTSDNVFNILLIGSDTREAGGSGRSDAMILISINKKTKKIIATSLLRDIYLQIPGKSNNRINSAFAYGGAGLLIDTIEQNFKIQIDRYASIDFYSFMDIVDAVGGVTITVTEEELPIINDYIRNLNRLTDTEVEKDILTESGTFLLNGKQALGYARNRYIGTDFERTARQRRVLEQAFLNIKDLNLIQLNDLLNQILPKITTDLTEGEIFSLLLGLPSYRNFTLEQWSIPRDGTYSFLQIRGMAVIGIDFEENIKVMHSSIYGEDTNGAKGSGETD